MAENTRWLSLRPGLLTDTIEGVQASAARSVVIVAFPDAFGLDVIGPADVFALANQVIADAYTVQIAASAPNPLALSGGLHVVPDIELHALAYRPDTVLVAGGPGAEAAATDGALLRWLRAVAPRTRRVGSVCTGALVLGAAGLLAGRRATTHWSACSELAARHPDARVEPDAIFVRDGPIVTSAGVTAAMDLALALVDEDYGPDVALTVSRTLVLPLRRGGGQSQYSAALRAQVADRPRLRELQEWLPDHLHENLTVAALAAKVAMSDRHFARAWRSETGQPPAAYVRALRVERARALLETNTAGIDTIAQLCGFPSPESLRRSFAQQLGVTPSAYRRRFSAQPDLG